MKLFQTKQIAEIDELTIANEPISHIDLMERAAEAFINAFISLPDFPNSIWVFCGPGNNGGDGLAIARILNHFPCTVTVVLLDSGKELSPSAYTNLKRLEHLNSASIIKIATEDEVPEIPSSALLIDALFGAGLTRPLTGLPAKVVQQMNQSGCRIVSVDIPSGLLGEDNANNNFDNVVCASHTIAFQFPKLSFLLPESGDYAGKWQVTDIGLHPKAIETMPSPYYYLTPTDFENSLKQPSRFSHKGSFGHALLISGSYGRMGAAILASKACLRTGVGLLTTHVPHDTYQVIQTAVPEAMCEIDESDLMFTSAFNINKYNAIGIGPAIGQKVNTQRGIKQLLTEINVPLVMDADAINILGLHPEYLNLLPSKTILTPHPKEFERICGTSSSRFGQIEKASKMAIERNIIVVLKGAYTAIATPDGNIFFNSTGNAGMATAGSGDVLTGIILSFMAQGYRQEEAAKLGVYLHGVAGDLAAEEKGHKALIASDIIDNLHRAFIKIER